MRATVPVSILLACLLFGASLRGLTQAEHRPRSTPASLPIVDAREGADLTLINGRIRTLDPAFPAAEWLAIRRGRIVALGLGGAPARWTQGKARVIDLRGAVALPGLWDAHAHLLSRGLERTQVDLKGTTSFGQVIERVRRLASETPAGTWIEGRGWDQNDWPAAEFGGEFPTHTRLSAAVPRHPVVLRRIDGHALLLNQAGLQKLGIHSRTRAPRGGQIVVDRTGRPTGVLVDAAMSLARSAGRTRTRAQVERALIAAAEECAQKGLVGIHDAGVSLETLEVYQDLFRRGRLRLRVYVLLDPSSARRWWAAGRRPLVNAFGGRLTVRAIKCFMDGALGSRGAALLAPYADKPDARGLPQQTTDRLAAFTTEAARRGFQVCTHAIGDAGVRRTLDAYERAQHQVGGDLRLRVEHAQVIAPSDIPRFGRLGIIPSMQPTHATSDMPWAEARLGPERVRGAYAWQRLLASGVEHLPLGSDFPVEAVSPLLGYYAAVTRTAPNGESPHGPGGWFPDQRLSRQRALLGFTRDAAYAAFQEHETGRLAVGRWADVVVFDRDLLTCPPAQIPTAQTRLTIVAGEVAHQQD